MRPRPDGVGPREWDQFCEWADATPILANSPIQAVCWSAWKESRHYLLITAELRQQDLMKRNTELVEKNRALDAQVKRLKTVLKEELSSY